MSTNKDAIGIIYFACLNLYTYNMHGNLLQVLSPRIHPMERIMMRAHWCIQMRSISFVFLSPNSWNSLYSDIILTREKSECFELGCWLGHHIHLLQLYVSQRQRTARNLFQTTNINSSGRSVQLKLGLCIARNMQVSSFLGQLYHLHFLHYSCACAGPNTSLLTQYSFLFLLPGLILKCEVNHSDLLEILV